MNIERDFFVVAREPGAENPALPTWGSRIENPAQLSKKVPQRIARQELPEVPGAFQLLNVFSQEECLRLIELSEGLGYLPDAAVSLPREVRHNDNMTWVTDDTTRCVIWQRCRSLLHDPDNHFDGREATGINARFRFYRYSTGDYFKFHTDGAWPGSRIINQQLIADAHPGHYSEMTFLILLSEDYEGGATRFRVNAHDPMAPVRGATHLKDVDIRTPSGSVLCFPHGAHPLHRIHSSVPITTGGKYIIRSDVLFRQS